MSDIERRRDSHDLTRRIDQVDAKVDLANAKIDAAATETRYGFERMTAVSEEHWKNFEQRLDAAAREQRQQIEFLTANTVRLQGELEQHARALSATETSLASQLSDVKRLQDRQIDIREDVKTIQENLKWTVRSLVLVSISFVASLAMYFINKGGRTP